MVQAGKWMLLTAISIFAVSCTAQKNIVNGDDDIPIAFPGAEGFGKYTTGGRGGKVMIVSNLDDDGPGSFREAAESQGKRTIVFSVSGTIHLKSKLGIRGHATIAGQTAPGDGICIADYPVTLNGDNIILRFLRFRMGDRFQDQGMVDGGGHDDALSAFRRKHIIIDHCSISWSTDEVFSVYGGDSTTLQWNIISEPLNYSYHFEKGDKDFENHGYGGIWGGAHLTAHHNLFAHCVNRNPRFNGLRAGSTTELVDYRNNVIYNWGSNSVYGGEGGNYNIINNYYRSGPATNKNVKFRIVSPSKMEDNSVPYGKFFVDGNFTWGDEKVSGNNRMGIVMGNGGTSSDMDASLISTPFKVDAINSQSAKDAYEAVMKFGGCIFPARDTLDVRIINDVKNGTGRIIDVQGGYAHGTPYTISYSAWPVLKSLPPPVDTDKDGMPDEWEIKNSLNRNDPSDANLRAGTFYTNLEIYINSLVKKP